MKSGEIKVGFNRWSASWFVEFKKQAKDEYSAKQLKKNIIKVWEFYDRFHMNDENIKISDLANSAVEFQQKNKKLEQENKQLREELMEEKSLPYEVKQNREILKRLDDLEKSIPKSHCCKQNSYGWID